MELINVSRPAAAPDIPNSSTLVKPNEPDSHRLHAAEVEGFVSAAHEYAIKQFNAYSESQDSKQLSKAETVASSMGQGGNYDRNPFSYESHRELAEAYEKAEKLNERLKEENLLSPIDHEMDNDS